MSTNHPTPPKIRRSRTSSRYLQSGVTSTVMLHNSSSYTDTSRTSTVHAANTVSESVEHRRTERLVVIPSSSDCSRSFPSAAPPTPTSDPALSPALIDPFAVLGMEAPPLPRGLAAALATLSPPNAHTDACATSNTDTNDTSYTPNISIQPNSVCSQETLPNSHGHIAKDLLTGSQGVIVSPAAHTQTLCFPAAATRSRGLHAPGTRTFTSAPPVRNPVRRPRPLGVGVDMVLQRGDDNHGSTLSNGHNESHGRGKSRGRAGSHGRSKSNARDDSEGTSKTSGNVLYVSGGAVSTPSAVPVIPRRMGATSAPRDAGAEMGLVCGGAQDADVGHTSASAAVDADGGRAADAASAQHTMRDTADASRRLTAHDIMGTSDTAALRVTTMRLRVQSLPGTDVSTDTEASTGTGMDAADGTGDGKGRENDSDTLDDVDDQVHMDSQQPARVGCVDFLSQATPPSPTYVPVPTVAPIYAPIPSPGLPSLSQDRRDHLHAGGHGGNDNKTDGVRYDSDGKMMRFHDNGGQLVSGSGIITYDPAFISQNGITSVSHPMQLEMEKSGSTDISDPSNDIQASWKVALVGVIDSGIRKNTRFPDRKASPDIEMILNKGEFSRRANVSNTKPEGNPDNLASEPSEVIPRKNRSPKLLSRHFMTPPRSSRGAKGDKNGMGTVAALESALQQAQQVLQGQHGVNTGGPQGHSQLIDVEAVSGTALVSLAESSLLAPTDGVSRHNGDPQSLSTHTQGIENTSAPHVHARVSSLSRPHSLPLDGPTGLSSPPVHGAERAPLRIGAKALKYTYHFDGGAHPLAIETGSPATHTPYAASQVESQAAMSVTETSTPIDTTPVGDIAITSAISLSTHHVQPSPSSPKTDASVETPGTIDKTEAAVNVYLTEVADAAEEEEDQDAKTKKMEENQEKESEAHTRLSSSTHMTSVSASSLSSPHLVGHHISRLQRSRPISLVEVLAPSLQLPPAPPLPVIVPTANKHTLPNTANANTANSGNNDNNTGNAMITLAANAITSTASLDDLHRNTSAHRNTVSNTISRMDRRAGGMSANLAVCTGGAMVRSDITQKLVPVDSDADANAAVGAGAAGEGDCITTTTEGNATSRISSGDGLIIAHDGLDYTARTTTTSPFPVLQIGDTVMKNPEYVHSDSSGTHITGVIPVPGNSHPFRRVSTARNRYQVMDPLYAATLHGMGDKYRPKSPEKDPSFGKTRNSQGSSVDSQLPFSPSVSASVHTSASASISSVSSHYDILEGFRTLAPQSFPATSSAARQQPHRRTASLLRDTGSRVVTQTQRLMSAPTAVGAPPRLPTTGSSGMSGMGTVAVVEARNVHAATPPGALQPAPSTSSFSTHAPHIPHTRANTTADTNATRAPHTYVGPVLLPRTSSAPTIVPTANTAILDPASGVGGIVHHVMLLEQGEHALKSSEVAIAASLRELELSRAYLAQIEAIEEERKRLNKTR